MRNALCVVVLLGLAGTVIGDDWKPLFNGKDLSGWQNAAGKQPERGWKAEDGALVRGEKGGDLWTKDRFGDFVLELEFKAEGNSGVFFRTDNPRDNVQTGIEMQVDRASRAVSKHSVGAMYDLLAPSKNAAKDGEWNKVQITAQGGRIQAVMNGEPIIDMDVDQWATPGKNPDGSPNKFTKALKDFVREGHIGLQDHGHAVAYRNIRIKELKAE
jgi:hypothetical protein